MCKPPSLTNTAVKKILDGANLEEITTKKVRELVGEAYPGVDLSGRKDLIKQYVDELLQ